MELGSMGGTHVLCVRRVGAHAVPVPALGREEGERGGREIGRGARPGPVEEEGLTGAMEGRGR